MKTLLTIVTLLFASTIQAQQCAAGFTKTDSTALEVVLKGIKEAKASVNLAAYQFTHKDILQALGAAVKRGVKVQVVMDKTQCGYETPEILSGFGVEWRIDRKHVIMHHKTIVIDGKDFITGSFNFSANAATRNAENALLCTGMAEVAKDYEREFYRVFDAADTTCKPTNSKEKPSKGNLDD